MDQLEQKEIANPPPTFPPPLVSRKEPEPAPIRKNSNKTEPSRTPQSSNSRKEQRSDKNIKELVKAQDEDPTASERVRQRDRSRSRDRDRRNFNRDGRNYHNHRRDRNDRGDRFGGRSSHYAGDEPSNKETYYKTKLCPNYLEVYAVLDLGKVPQRRKMLVRSRAALTAIATELQEDEVVPGLLARKVHQKQPGVQVRARLERNQA